MTEVNDSVSDKLHKWLLSTKVVNFRSFQERDAVTSLNISFAPSYFLWKKAAFFSYFWKSVLPNSVAMGSPLPTFLCLKFPKTVVIPSYSLLFSTLSNRLLLSSTVKKKRKTVRKE